MERKRTKSSKNRPSRSIKRKFYGNRYTVEQETSFVSTSAEKLRRTNDNKVSIDQTFGYCIVQFFAVFSGISDLVICRQCRKDVKFNQTSSRGLGFKIAVECECGVSYVNSSPFVRNAFEINRRIVFVMRLLGIGVEGLRLFCGLMDMATDFYSTTYYKCMENVNIATSAVYDLVTRSAIEEEKEKTLNEENSAINLTVSGDGTWKTRGYSSLFGVTTLVGKYSKKIVDLILKSNYCKMCETWENKLNDEKALAEWKENHAQNCSINHDGSAAKMEVESVKEMFGRSMEKYGVKYTRYIGDGDSKTFKGIIDFNPYDEEVKKLECVLHVKKRMGTRLRNEKKKHKGIGGKGTGKLTDKLIDDLTEYYKLAILRNTDSTENMRKAIWATYYHKISTDDEPQHMYCPPGPTSWCAWRRCESEGKLDVYKHDAPLTPAVQNVIKPVYEDLSKPDLLQRCLGGNTQNNNESFNGLLWHFAPKYIYCGKKTVEMAMYISAIIFNDGFNAILKTFEIMGLTIGQKAYAYAQHRDNNRTTVAERRMSDAAQKARIALKNEKISLN